ncbi:MAG: hypothetical protein HRU38_04000, partial [Saccharospirillaceae bacterium]|nr:hypothetical protein [Pseudomonadales bacterium]NRB77827.1 hypothetical protein [Saccharospirillaceae bacterium]
MVINVNGSLYSADRVLNRNKPAKPQGPDNNNPTKRNVLKDVSQFVENNPETQSPDKNKPARRNMFKDVAKLVENNSETQNPDKNKSARRNAFKDVAK